MAQMTSATPGSKKTRTARGPESVAPDRPKAGGPKNAPTDAMVFTSAVPDARSAGGKSSSVRAKKGAYTA